MGRILVTGAAGFIGARTCSLLLEQGHEVVGVDNLNDYYDVRLKQLRLSGLADRPGFFFERLDIEDREAVLGRLADGPFDAVINLAARAGVRASVIDPFVYLATNAEGTLNLLEAMRRCGVPKLVLASTSSLYAGQPLPYHEEQPANTPASPYAASKKAAEALAHAYHHLHGLDVSIVRYFTVYGPAGRPDMAPFRFVRSIVEGEPLTLLGEGTQGRDFTYVDDIARGTLAALAPLGYEIINLGGGQGPVSLLQVIRILEGLAGRSATIEQRPAALGDVRETHASIDKARRLLRWEPEISIEVGLERTLAWYLENRILARQLRG